MVIVVNQHIRLDNLLHGTVSNIRSSSRLAPSRHVQAYLTTHLTDVVNGQGEQDYLGGITRPPCKKRKTCKCYT